MTCLKKAVRFIVNTTLPNTLAELGISQTTVAYSRPKNIKDLLSKAKLHQAEGKEVSVYYSGGAPSKYVQLDCSSVTKWDYFIPQS